MLPVVPPKHNTLVTVPLTLTKELGWFTKTLKFDVQPFASVTVTSYVAAHKPFVVLEPVAPFDQE